MTNLNTLSDSILRQLCDRAGFLSGTKSEMVQNLLTVNEGVLSIQVREIKKSLRKQSR